MDKIRQLAYVSVGRACGFAVLAIFTIMVGLSFDPALSAKSGAVMFAIAATVLWFFARTAPHRNPRRTELWCMLDADEQPPPAIAQRVVGAALAEAYRRFTVWALLAGTGLWLLSLALRLML